MFFTGAFRRPRELNWLIGFGLLVFALAEGFTGYSLPDDLLSGTGARIAYSVAISIPFVGPYLGSLAFGGEFPTAAFLPRFFVLHVMLLPALFAGAIAAHVGLVFLQKHTQYARRPCSATDNVVGRHFWPGQAFLSAGLFFLTAAVMALMGGLVQINPVWAYGPFEPAIVSLARAARLVRGLARRRAPDLPAVRARDPGDHRSRRCSSRASWSRARCSRSSPCGRSWSGG